MVTAITAIVAALATGAGLGVGKQYSWLIGMVQSMIQWSSTDLSVTFASDLYKFFAPLGITLALCYALMEIIDAMQRQGNMSNITPDIIILPLLKFAICIYLISHFPAIMGAILGSSNSVIQRVEAIISPDSVSEIAARTVTPLNSASGVLAKIFFELLPSFLSIIGQVIAALIIGMQVITIRVEMLLRFIFMPFAIANIAHGGAQSSGMRYFKRFLGAFVLMAGILLSIKLTYLISVSISYGLSGLDESAGSKLLQGILGFLCTSLIGPFAAVGAVSAVKSTVDQAFG